MEMHTIWSNDYDVIESLEKEIMEKVNPVKKQNPPVATPGL